MASLQNLPASLQRHICGFLYIPEVYLLRSTNRITRTAVHTEYLNQRLASRNAKHLDLFNIFGVCRPFWARCHGCGDIVFRYDTPALVQRGFAAGPVHVIANGQIWAWRIGEAHLGSLFLNRHLCRGCRLELTMFCIGRASGVILDDRRQHKRRWFQPPVVAELRHKWYHGSKDKRNDLARLLHKSDGIFLYNRLIHGEVKADEPYELNLFERWGIKWCDRVHYEWNGSKLTVRCRVFKSWWAMLWQRVCDIFN
jgi:hypothetical protein